MSDSQSAVHPGLAHHFDTVEQQRESSSLGMWVFLAQEVMFFGGLFLTYLVYRSAYPIAFAEASHHLSVPLGGTNTVILITSSLTMALAVFASETGKQKMLIAFLLLTLILGMGFLGIKTVEYHDKYIHHLIPGLGFTYHGPHAPQAQIFFSLYFVMTGMHALHMVIGMGLLIWLMALARKGKFNPEYHTPVEVFGLYWHFVDIVWIFLFPLLYLIGLH